MHGTNVKKKETDVNFEYISFNRQ